MSDCGYSLQSPVAPLLGFSVSHRQASFAYRIGETTAQAVVSSHYVISRPKPKDGHWIIQAARPGHHRWSD